MSEISPAGKAVMDAVVKVYPAFPDEVAAAALRAALAQPEPEGPTDEELWELYDQLSGEPEDWPWIRDYARALLALCKK